MRESKYKIPLIFLILIAIGLAIVFKPYDNPIETAGQFQSALVTKVVDGDTIYADVGDYNEKIRFVGLNTPEINLEDGSDEYFGREAFDYSKKLLTNKKIYLEQDLSDRDKYQRMLRIVWFREPDDINNISFEEFRDNTINAKLVKEGYAIAHVYPPDDKYGDWLAELEKEAKDNKLGMWADRNSNNISTEKIKGNKNSKIYHLPGGENYNNISEKNTIYFESEEDAIAAGFKRAKN